MTAPVPFPTSQSLVCCGVLSTHTKQHRRGSSRWRDTCHGTAVLQLDQNKHVFKLGIQPSHLSAASSDCHMFCLQRKLYKQAWERTQQSLLYIYICNICLIITSTMLNSLPLKRGREEGISGCCGVCIIFIYLSTESWNLSCTLSGAELVLYSTYILLPLFSNLWLGRPVYRWFKNKFLLCCCSCHMKISTILAYFSVIPHLSKHLNKTWHDKI